MQADYIWEQYLDLCVGTRELDILRAELIPDPIVVGAVGGSGTRVVRDMLCILGVEMMKGISAAGDAHAWPPLERILGSHGARFSSRDALCSHAFSVLEHFLQERADKVGHKGPVGWKNPGCFLWLPELSQYFPKMRYVHVIRHGLDMAYSKNIRQFRTKHWYFGIQSHEMAENPRDPIRLGKLLDYWIAANQFSLEQCRELPVHHYLLVYEDLCAQPLEQTRRLAEFLCLSASEQEIVEAAGLVSPNPAVGRFREQDWKQEFTPEQLAAVEDLGFSI